MAFPLAGAQKAWQARDYLLGLPVVHTEGGAVVTSELAYGAGAGTGMGCSKHVRQGRVQPNEHGTWYTGYAHSAQSRRCWLCSSS